jgi:hypothetical protein
MGSEGQEPIAAITLEPVAIVDATIANRKPSPRLGVVVEFPLSVGTIP